MRFFSAIQPSSQAPHLGNLAGALLPWIEIMSNFKVLKANDSLNTSRFLVCLADVHSLTNLNSTQHEIGSIREKTFSMACAILACGLDEFIDNKTRDVSIFVQSHVIIFKLGKIWFLLINLRMNFLIYSEDHLVGCVF